MSSFTCFSQFLRLCHVFIYNIYLFHSLSFIILIWTFLIVKREIYILIIVFIISYVQLIIYVQFNILHTHMDRNLYVCMIHIPLWGV